MSDIGVALISLAGVPLGGVLTLVTGRLSENRTQQNAADAALERRLDEARVLAADAFVLALDGVAWLHPNRVEDSVLPQFEEEFAPRYEESIAKVRQARAVLNKAAALDSTGRLTEPAAEVARLLGVLADAWDGARKFARRMHAETTPRKPNTVSFDQEIFLKEFNRLSDARLALTGLDTRLTREEVDVGGLDESGWLAKLRGAIAGADLMTAPI